MSDLSESNRTIYGSLTALDREDVTRVLWTRTGENKPCLTTWVNETPERRRSYEQERLIVDVAEAVQGLLDKAGMKRAELGRRTGIARQSLHQMLSGQQNLTLRTMATIAHELGYRVSVSFEPYCGEST